MNDRWVLALTLFHDVGEPLEWFGGYTLTPDLPGKETCARSRYSALLIRTLVQPAAVRSLMEISSREVEALIFFHHCPTIPENRIRLLADWLASVERDQDKENTQTCCTIPLRSVFSGRREKTKDSLLSSIGPDTLKPRSIGKVSVDLASCRRLREGCFEHLFPGEFFDDLYAVTEDYLIHVSVYATW